MSFSYLRGEDGKRVLICPLCDTEWLYRYLACSRYGNDNHKRNMYFEVAEFPAYEVYLCGNWHGYLKTFNGKKGLVTKIGCSKISKLTARYTGIKKKDIQERVRNYYSRQT